MAIATVAASPVRVKPSPKARIVEIRGTSYKAEPIASNCPDVIAAWRLLNLANGNVYDLAVSDQTGVSCDCPDAEFRHRDAGTLCKHARECIRAGLFDAADIALDGDGVVVGVRRSGGTHPVSTPARVPFTIISAERSMLADRPAPCCPAAEAEPCAACVPPPAAYLSVRDEYVRPTEAELLECLADRPDPVAVAWNDGWRAALLAHGILN